MPTQKPFTMLFNSFVFIFAFLPLTWLLYFGLCLRGLRTTAKSVLVVASLYFYAYFNWSYLPIIVSSILVNYGVATAMTRNSSKGFRQLLLTTGLIFNIGLIGYFKYADFFIENCNVLFGTDWNLLHILLPLGISFFTFQQIAFVIDCYQRRLTMPSFLDYCNFVTFFPQLIAGPIVLPDEMLPQFDNPTNSRPRAKNVMDGLFIFTIGLFKKVIIADSIAVFANAGFGVDTEYMTMAEAWLTSLSYTFQLYFDFSGYCDMAIGIGRMFNINLPLNFNAPYLSGNFREFWHRWHITLNRFLTTYLYFPLGGSRVGTMRTYANILIVFLVSGLWHGAGWTFVLWGFLHGIGVVVCRLWSKTGHNLPRLLGIVVTFFFVNILWVIFRADTMERAWFIVRSMFNNMDLRLTQTITSHLPSILPNTANMIILFAAMVIAVVGPTGYQMMLSPRLYRWKCAFVVIAFVCSVLFLSRVSVFLYFNF